MADLSAVLRKTIDGLPNATPELRAKVYEKARTAIARQIENADPPLSDDVVAMRRSALEDAIRATEAHYEATQDAARPADPMPVAEPAPPPPPPQIARPAIPAPRTTPTAKPPAAEAPRLPRAETNFRDAPAAEASTQRPAETPRAAKTPARRDPAFDTPRAPPSVEPEGGFDIPDADTSAPRYSPTRSRSGAGRKPVLVATAAVALVAALGVGGYLYRDQIEGLFGSGDSRTAASTPPAASETAPPANQSAALPSNPDAATPPASDAGTPQHRRFTQRLQTDGSEVDEGPGPTNANAFDEGTNIAAATPEAVPALGTPAAPPPAQSGTAPNAVPPAQSAPPQPANNAAPAVGQKAVFYEERTASLQGTQQTGNVVWSLINEPPAEGQPAEPAIRAVADVPSEKLKMTMTIRRNLDPTLPASHVIELQFDMPPNFAGGQVANIQRLALKPSEEARGEPLIGVAGKISDGFFIIALNNLDKATETNLSLLGREEWIDIPIAYATGRRALMSIEKGVPGDRIFKEAMDAWAAKT